MKPTRIVNGTLAALLAVGTVACSTPRKPAQEIEKAEQAISSADTTTAPVDAPLEMKLAREKTDKAKAALADEEYELARQYAEQAQVDAQLAEAKAESEAARENARELERTIDTLRGEAQRGVEAQP